GCLEYGALVQVLTPSEAEAAAEGRFCSAFRGEPAKLIEHRPDTHVPARIADHEENPHTHRGERLNESTVAPVAPVSLELAPYPSHRLRPAISFDEGGDR